MVTTTMAETPAETMTAVECGEWLLVSLAESESALATWLERLVRFDLDQGWAADGQLSCVDWLMWRARMSRSTAYERLQVAHQLRRRPTVAEAFRSGRISYSAVRVLARMVDPDPEVDEAMVALAEVAGVRDVERMVGWYQRHADQDRRPLDTDLRRGVRTRPNYDGTTTLEITLDDLEAADLKAVIDAFQAREPDATAAADESARADGGRMDSGRADGGARSAPTDSRPPSARRADAVMEMARTAIKHLDGGRATGDDRYLVHVLQSGEGMSLLDGTRLDSSTAARLCEDASATTLLLGPGWEPLAMGRKTRTWTAAQRRAILIRDGGQCRFPGCQARQFLQAHHHRWWSRGGPTDVSNGWTGCSYHHDLVHDGWTVTGDPNHELVFHRPDGTELGRTRPRLRAS